MHDIYLYGMVLLTESLLLAGAYPEADGYGEIAERYTVTGGETGTCATILSSLGTSVKMDGNHLGRDTYGPIRDFYGDLGVDMSPMTYDAEYAGLTDMVVIGGHTRTCFGAFGRYFSDPAHGRWNSPRREDIEGAKAAGIDPFFFEASASAARMCHEQGKKYVTIDCDYDSELHAYCEVNVISNDFIRWHYPDRDIDGLMAEYMARSEGLVIFTSGAKEILYGRKGEDIKRFSPYRVEVQSTLGAGDSFKAGAVYAVLQGMDDRGIVSFASATAAAAVSRYPIPKYPPDLKTIQEIIDSRQ